MTGTFGLVDWMLIDTISFVGYGHSTPHTIGGKLFTMAYALVGIPLGLVMFQSIGERLNNFSSFVIRNVKRVLKYDSIEASETNLILVVTVCYWQISLIL